MASFAPEGFVFVPEGPFLYGPETCYERKIEGLSLKPRQVMNLPAFWMARLPVTCRDWREFLQKTGYPWEGQWYRVVKGWRGVLLRAYVPVPDYPQGHEDYPIVDVSLQDAQSYAEWYGRCFDLPGAIPTEYQWEKAARGVDGRPYPWGSQVPRPDIQWQRKFPVGLETYFFSLLIRPRHPWARAGWHWRNGHPIPAGSVEINVSPYGCTDMSGNVWEWTVSRYHTSLPDFHVVKGGSWGYSIHHCQLFVRSACSLTIPSREYRAPGTGFRLVLNCDEQGRRQKNIP